MEPIIITNDEAFENAICSEQIVLIEFYKMYCPYCIKVEAVIKEVTQILAGKTKVYVIKVSGTRKENYKNQYGFSRFPRCALFKNGKMVQLLDIPSEELSKEKLLAFVQQHSDILL